MKKRTKKNNPAKRMQVFIDASLSGLCFGIKSGAKSKAVECYKMKDGTIGRISKAAETALINCRFNFAILLVVDSVESNGKERTVTNYERLQNPWRQSELVDYLNSIQTQMINDELKKGNEVKAAGWMICPIPSQPDDDIYQMMLDITTNESR